MLTFDVIDNLFLSGNPCQILSGCTVTPTLMVGEENGDGEFRLTCTGHTYEEMRGSVQHHSELLACEDKGCPRAARYQVSCSMTGVGTKIFCELGVAYFRTEPELFTVVGLKEEIDFQKALKDLFCVD
jgi:hypothetical protein